MYGLINYFELDDATGERKRNLLSQEACLYKRYMETLACVSAMCQL